MSHFGDSWARDFPSPLGSPGRKGRACLNPSTPGTVGPLKNHNWSLPPPHAIPHMSGPLTQPQMPASPLLQELLGCPLQPPEWRATSAVSVGWSYAPPAPRPQPSHTPGLAISMHNVTSMPLVQDTLSACHHLTNSYVLFNTQLECCSLQEVGGSKVFSVLT